MLAAKLIQGLRIIYPAQAAADIIQLGASQGIVRQRSMLRCRTFVLVETVDVVHFGPETLSTLPHT